MTGNDVGDGLNWASMSAIFWAYNHSYFEGFGDAASQ